MVSAMKFPQFYSKPDIKILKAFNTPMKNNQQ